MKKFLVRLLIFMVLLTICASVTDLFISWRLRNNDNRLWSGWNQVYDDTTHYDLVILGASEVWTGYNPAIIDSILNIKSFDCAFDGSGINRQILKYHKFVELHGQPDVVVMSVDMGFLGQTYGYEREQFFPYFIFDRDLVAEADKYEDFSWAEKYVPCYRYLGYYDVILEALVEDNMQHFYERLYNGFCARDCQWNGSELALLDSTYFDLSDSISLTQLRDFLRAQKNNGTKVVLVFTPIYYGAIEKCTNLKDAYQLYDAIAKEYNTEILHYYENSICQDTMMFYNATHLNREGSTQFSKQFAKDVDSLLYK